MSAAGVCAAVDAAFETRDLFPRTDKHVHESRLVECPNGDLPACWFHGSGERTADDVQVRGARLRRGETAWGTAEGATILHATLTPEWVSAAP